MAKKVLIVDDELHMRVFMTTLLEVNGFKPLAAGDGNEGLKLAREKKPVLIIMDMMMPKESGIEMYRQVKTDAELKDIPVIVVSGLSKKTFLHSQKMLDQHYGVRLPDPAAYIEKPPEADELLAAIHAALKS